MGFKLMDLAKAAGAACDSDAHIGAVCTDSRSIAPGALFVALRGENFDGHAFVDAAVQAGAAAVLVDHPVPTRVPCLVVPDTLRALGDMAAWVRWNLGRPVAAVTGSNGKTTTKELLAVALGGRTPVHKTAGNFNNAIGLPLTLFSWPDAAWAAVLEMGMNAPGEITRLTQIAQPNVGVVTCVAVAHLGGKGLGSLENIAQAKAELYAAMPADAVAVINADDAPLCAAAAPYLAHRRVMRFGVQDNVDVQVRYCEPTAQGLQLVLHMDGRDITCALPLLGRHNALNAAAAAAAAFAMGVSADDACFRLRNVEVPGSRLLLRRNVGPGISVIDDTYNANPGSMQAAFSALADVAGTSRRIVALGDMLELGENAAALHYAVGEGAARAGVAQVFAVGPFAESTMQGAQSCGVHAEAFSSIDSLFAALRNVLQAGDVLLVKGSRGMRMERLVQLVVGEQA